MNSHDFAADIRAAVQAVLDASDDPGWHVAQFVVCMGLERINSGGQYEATAWLWVPPCQADWMTDGLLEAATDMRCSAEVDDD